MPADGPALRRALDELACSVVGDHVESLLALHYFSPPLLEIGHGNVAILAELAGATDPDGTATATAGLYVCLLAHCDLVDRCVDGEIELGEGVLAAVGTLSLFQALCEQIVMADVEEERQGLVRQRIWQRLAEQRRALQIELDRRSGWEAPGRSDAIAATERSAAVVLFYELLAYLGGREPVPAVVELLEDYLCAFQLGDDLGDWAEDLAAENHTSLLRGCRTARGSAIAVSDLPRELFLGGYYELYTARLACQLDDILARLDTLPEISSSRMRRYVESRRDDAMLLLRRAVTAKLEALQAEGLFA